MGCSSRSAGQSICVSVKLNSVRWRPCATLSAVGCNDYDGVVTEYDAEHNVAAWERNEHTGRRVWSLDYAPGGAMVASGSDNRMLHIGGPASTAGGAVLCVESGTTPSRSQRRGAEVRHPAPATRPGREVRSPLHSKSMSPLTNPATSARGSA
jgi:WD40 repeat protein